MCICAAHTFTPRAFICLHAKRQVQARASIRPAFRNKLTIGAMRDELRCMKRGGEGAGLFAMLDKEDQQQTGDRAPSRPLEPRTPDVRMVAHSGPAAAPNGAAASVPSRATTPPRGRVAMMKAGATKAGASKRTTRGFGSAALKKKKMPIVALPPEIASVIADLQAEDDQSIERYSRMCTCILPCMYVFVRNDVSVGP